MGRPERSDPGARPDRTPGVSIAMSKVAAAKKIPFIAIGAGGASLTGADCTPRTPFTMLATIRLRHSGNGTASAIIKRGRQDLVLHYRRLRLLGTQWCKKRRPKWYWPTAARYWAPFVRPLGTTDYSLVPVAGASLGRASAGPRERGYRFLELAQGQANEFGIAKTMKPPRCSPFSPTFMPPHCRPRRVCI